MSLLPAYTNELFRAYEEMHREDIRSINPLLVSTDSALCHESLLPYLAWEADINISEFNQEQLRVILDNAIKSCLTIGTRSSLESIFEGVSTIELTEYFETKPFYFKAKMLLEDDIPSINKYAYLINKYKNARSHYELEFNLDTNVDFKESTASSLAVNFFEDLEFEKEFHLVMDAKNSFHSGFDAKLAFDKELHYMTSASSTLDVETSRDFFDVDRLSDVKNQAIANIRLDFSYNDSDVMHLPIPPIVINSMIVDNSVAVFDLDFGGNKSDIFHLNYEKKYEVLGGIGIDNYSVIDMEFYDSGVDFNTTVQTLAANAVQSVNLDI